MIRRKKEDVKNQAGYIHQEECHLSRPTVFLVAIVSFIVAVCIVLLIIFTRLEQEPTPSYADENDCYDIAIIGAGLSGTYTAWKLSQSNKSIRIYESSNRIGGRLYTRSFPHSPEVNLELGAAYFTPFVHKRMATVIKKLGLTTSKVSSHSSRKNLEYFLRGQFLTHEDLNTSIVPYNLKPDEMNVYPSDLLSKILQAKLSEKDGFERNFDNVDDTYKASLEDTLLAQVSSEARRFLSDTLPPETFRLDGGAAAIAAQLPELLFDGESATILEGMESLPRELIRHAMRANDRLELKKNHRLTKIEFHRGAYRLYFTRTSSKEYVTTDTKTKVEECAKSVVLAMPPEALRQVNWQPFTFGKFIGKYLRSVARVPAIKFFLEYTNGSQWQSIRRMRTDLPVRDVENLASENASLLVNGTESGFKSASVLAVSAAGSFTNYWRRFIGGITSKVSLPAEHKVTEKLLEHAQHYLSKLIDNATLVLTSPPSGAVVHNWHAAWHVYKPGFDWQDVTRRMLRPTMEDRLYVVGSAFASAHVQTLAEGALETVDRMIHEYF